MKFWEMVEQVSKLILVVVVLFWSSFIVLWSSISACVMTNRIGWNDGFQIEKSKLIWVHHVVDHETVNTGYIYQFERIAQVEIYDPN